MVNMEELRRAIRRHWKIEFEDNERDCNWASFIMGDWVISVIGPTRGEPDLSGCRRLIVDGIEFFYK